MTSEIGFTNYLQWASAVGLYQSQDFRFVAIGAPGSWRLRLGPVSGEGASFQVVNQHGQLRQFKTLEALAAALHRERVEHFEVVMYVLDGGHGQ